MTNDVDPLKVVQYEANIRQREQQWRAALADIERSDRAAVDLGINAVKTGVLINAGALVAILAFTGQRWNEQPTLAGEVLSHSHSFVVGLISVALGSGVAYFYQSFVTLKSEKHLVALSTGKPDKHFKRVSHIVSGFAVVMVALVIAGYVEFIVGITSVMRALHP